MKNKIFTAFISLFIAFVFILPVFAESDISEKAFVIDNADILSDREEADLLSAIEELNDNYSIEAVILTVDSLEGKSASQYADDYFDYKGYGYGSDRDGILMLYKDGVPGDREIYFSTHGSCIEQFNNSAIEIMTGNSIQYLKNNDYFGAFNAFVDYAGPHLYDYTVNPDSSDENETVPLVWIPISLVVGLIIAFIIMKSFSSSLKSVRPKYSAADYVISGSMNITSSHDRFIHKTVTKTKIPKESSSSSGSSSSSSTHTSSSGSTHGGGGARF